MALASGTIVVACPGFSPADPKGLFAVDPADGRLRPLAQGGMLAEPWNVVFLADGRLLVSDASAFGTGGLITVDPDSGRQTKVSSSAEFLRPFGMALAADGQVVVAYTQRAGAPGTLARVDLVTGEHRGVAPDFRFDQPFGVAIDRAGNVIVTDPGLFTGEPNRLIRIDIGVGASIRDDSGGAYAGVAVEPTGNLVVTSDIPERQRLLRFDPTSGPPTVVSQAPAMGSSGVAVEAGGAILVTDPHRVIRVDPATGAQTTVASIRGAMGLAVRR